MKDNPDKRGMANLGVKKKIRLRIVESIRIDAPNTNIMFPAGKDVDQAKRQEMVGGSSGGATASKYEKLQRKYVAEWLGECPTTNLRHYRRGRLVECARPFKTPDGFSYTEDYDGSVSNGRYLVNFKCVLSTGGAQTRSLRCVAEMVEAQVSMIKKWLDDDKNDSGMAYTNKDGQLRRGIYGFVNMLDGDEAHAKMSHLQQIVREAAREEMSDHIYIGDTRGGVEWLRTRIPTVQNV